MPTVMPPKAGDRVAAPARSATRRLRRKPALITGGGGKGHAAPTATRSTGSNKKASSSSSSSSIHSLPGEPRATDFAVAKAVLSAAAKRWDRRREGGGSMTLAHVMRVFEGAQGTDDGHVDDAGAADGGGDGGGGTAAESFADLDPGSSSRVSRLLISLDLRPEQLWKERLRGAVEEHRLALELRRAERPGRRPHRHGGRVTARRTRQRQQQQVAATAGPGGRDLGLGALVARAWRGWMSFVELERMVAAEKARHHAAEAAAAVTRRGGVVAAAAAAAAAAADEVLPVSRQLSPDLDEAATQAGGLGGVRAGGGVLYSPAISTLGLTRPGGEMTPLGAGDLATTQEQQLASKQKLLRVRSTLP
jgi:hypothetical protein